MNALFAEYNLNYHLLLEVGMRCDLKTRFWPILTGAAFWGEGSLPQLVKFLDGRQTYSDTTVNVLFAEYNLDYHLLLQVGIRRD